MSRVQSVVGSNLSRGSFEKVTALGVLCYFAFLFVCMILLASFYLPSSSLIIMYNVCDGCKN